MSLTKEEFENTLRSAVVKREICYKHVYPLHCRWEGDETAADREEGSFRSILNLCGFPSPEVLILEAAGWPGFDLFGKTISILKQALETEESSLIIIHYAGDSLTSEDGNESMLTNGQKRIKMGTIFDLLLDTYYGYLENQSIDVLMIFDCCFNSLATRKM